MRPLLKKALDLPEIPVGHSPVIWIEHAKIDHRISLDASRVIDVTLSVAQSECTWSREERFPSMQPRISRAGDRPPSGGRAVDEDHMVEQIDGFEAEYEWRISVLFEDGCCEERGLEAVNGSRSQDSSKSSHRVACRLGVVRELVEPSLNLERSAKLPDELALCPCEREVWWLDLARVRKS